MKEIDLVNKYVEEHHDMFYLENQRAQDISHIKKRRKTLKELIELRNIYDKSDKKLITKDDPFKDLE
jgi:hypothetical protein